jgi:hypothetical protein
MKRNEEIRPFVWSGNEDIDLGWLPQKLSLTRD